MDATIEKQQGQKPIVDQTQSLLYKDAATARNMGGLHSSPAISANETHSLVQKGTLPSMDIVESSPVHASPCDLSYTRDDWSKERAKNADTLKEIRGILERKDFPAFKEVFTDPNLSPDVREEFLKGGARSSINAAFGDSMSLSKTREQRDADDYARYGQLSLPSKIRDEEGFLGLDRQGVEKAIKAMSPEEQAKYRSGKLMADANNWPATGAQRDALNYYNDVQESLKDASAYSIWGRGAVDGKQVQTWESEIMNLPTAKAEPLDSCAAQAAEVRQELKKTYDEQFQSDINRKAQEIVDAILLKQRLMGN
ncbi:MAG: hypothetical protein JSS86_04715 [Cyanobacteria bacterium SZAS LIN-2]|nr:hypothetical protein [Cyanobacteria bacterium SZAS LIN-2]